MTTIVMTYSVRDDIDILGINLEYHLAQGVDFFIVTDRGSKDGTVDLLRQLRDRGLLEFIQEEVTHFDQGACFTRMARLAASKYQADWVINNDADEIWWPEQGTLTSTLEAVPEEVGMLVVDRFNFAPRSQLEGSFIEGMLIREVASLNSIGIPLPPKLIHRGSPRVTVNHGNHAMEGDDLGRTLATRSISVFHYPMRTYPQFEKKIVTGAQALQRNHGLDSAVGNTWRWLYEEHRHGRLRDFYESKMLTDEQLGEALARGTHVIDTRLRDFLRERDLLGGVCSSESPARTGEGVGDRLLVRADSQ